MKFEIAMEPMASPRPRFSSKGGFVKAYMPKEYMAWKAQLLFKWKLLKLKQEVSGKPLFVKLGFYLEPPIAVSKIKKNQAALEAETIPVVKKPDIDNLQKSVLDALNKHAWPDDNQISNIYAKKRYSLRPRIEIEVTEVE